MLDCLGTLNCSVALNWQLETAFLRSVEAYHVGHVTVDFGVYLRVGESVVKVERKHDFDPESAWNQLCDPLSQAQMLHGVRKYRKHGTWCPKKEIQW